MILFGIELACDCVTNRLGHFMESIFIDIKKILRNDKHYKKNCEFRIFFRPRLAR